MPEKRASPDEKVDDQNAGNINGYFSINLFFRNFLFSV